MQETQLNSMPQCLARKKGYDDQSPQFITHAELLRVAERNHCIGIHAEPVLALCRPEKNFWVFKATVFKSSK